MPHRFDRAVLGRHFTRRGAHAGIARHGSRGQISGAPRRNCRCCSHRLSITLPKTPVISKGYPPGIREAGQYPWRDMGRDGFRDARRRRSRRRTVIDAQSIRHSDSPAGVHRYARSDLSPAPMYSVPPHVRRGDGLGTQARAAWMYRVALEWVPSSRAGPESDP